MTDEQRYSTILEHSLKQIDRALHSFDLSIGSTPREKYTFQHEFPIELVGVLWSMDIGQRYFGMWFGVTVRSGRSLTSSPSQCDV
jgi:hypothetical protein